MLVQVKKIATKSIMRRDNGYFATNQSNVNISVLRKTFIISSIRLLQFVGLAAVVCVSVSCFGWPVSCGLSCGRVCLDGAAAWGLVSVGLFAWAGSGVRVGRSGLDGARSRGLHVATSKPSSMGLRMDLVLWVRLCSHRYGLKFLL
jgi:hypothetical protein